MIEKIKKIIEKNKTKDFSGVNEYVIKQTIVPSFLRTLGWDTDDFDEVTPEFGIDNKRIDFCLRLNKQNKVFIEVKKTTEELEKHEEQLINYSFRSDVKLAILTNGIEWWFYLPRLETPSWRERKIYSIHILTQDIDEISARFRDFLSKEYIHTEKALVIAKEIHSSGQKLTKIRNSLPIAWSSLIKSRNEYLIELLSEETEKICSFRPSKEQVEQFLANIFRTTEYVEDDEYQSDEDNNGLGKTSKTRSEPYDDFEERRRKGKATKIKVTFERGGKIIEKPMAIDTMIEVIKHFGIEEVSQHDITNGMYPLIIPKVSISKMPENRYKKIEGSPFYVYSNNSTSQKVEYLKRISSKFQEKFRIEIVD